MSADAQDQQEEDDLYEDGFPGEDYGDEDEEGNEEEYVVVLGGPKGQAYNVQININGKCQARISPMNAKGVPDASKAVELVLSDLDWHVGQPLAYGVFHTSDARTGEEAEAPVVIQTLGNTAEGYTLRYLGSEQEVIVRTPQEHALHRHMLPPVVKDHSKHLLCPMPGTLISCSVTVGQKVEAGQQLAVVEAMKMQNVLRAERAGVIAAVHKKAGNHLKVDEVIIEFE